MAEPLDAVRAIHNAFRRDMALIDDAAYAAARGGGDLSKVVERYQFFNEVLAWHAHGEELAIFPVLEGVAPLVAEAYEKDHRGLDALFDSMGDAISRTDALGTARVTSAFRFHLGIHLDKEDAHLYRIIAERVSVQDQGKAVGIMAEQAPQDRFAEVVAWMFPLMGNDDRENMTRIWQMVMPDPAFAGAKGLIQNAIGDDWAELLRRIPALAT